MLFFSKAALAHNNPVYLIRCTGCEVEEVNAWFFRKVIQLSKESVEPNHHTVWSRNKIIVFNPNNDQFQAYESRVSIPTLAKGDLESAFYTRKTPLSKKELRISSQLIEYNQLLNMEFKQAAQRLSKNFSSAEAITTWFPANYSNAFPDKKTPAFKLFEENKTCRFDPQYLTIYSVFSKSMLNKISSQASEQINISALDKKFPDLNLSHEKNFIKASTQGLDVRLAKTAFDQTHPVYLKFSSFEGANDTSAARYNLSMDGGNLIVKAIPSLSFLGDTSIELLSSYGGEVSQCAVFAMNKFGSLTDVLQTKIAPSITANKNNENQSLCSYVYKNPLIEGEMKLGSTCLIVKNKDKIKNLQKLR